MKYSIFSLFLGMALLLSLTFLNETKEVAISKEPKTTVHVSWIDYSLDELVAISEFIAEGKITKKLDTYFVSFNVEGSPNFGHYYTDYEFEVKKYYKNNTNESLEKLVITQLGSDDFIVTDFPLFKINSQLILFLYPDRGNIVPGKLVVSPVNTYKKGDGNQIVAYYGLNKGKADDSVKFEKQLEELVRTIKHMTPDEMAKKKALMLYPAELANPIPE